MEKDQHNAYHYKDNLCFFHCLAIGKFGKTRHNCNGKAKELFNQYCEHFQVTSDEFKVIELEDFYTLENFYEVQLFAMSFTEDGSAETLYLCKTSYKIKIYMNVYHHHLSFITDPNMYSNSYIISCNRCGKVSTKMSDKTTIVTSSNVMEKSNSISQEEFTRTIRLCSMIWKG